MTHAKVLSAILAAIVTAGVAQAGEFRVRAESGYRVAFADAASLTAASGFQNTYSIGSGTRLMWEGGANGVRYELHATLNLATGSQVAAAAALGGPKGPPPTLFDLTGTWSINSDTMAIGRIDRASVSFSTDNLVVKVGRQAITWGSGHIFHPLDMIAPFSPQAIDTSYKPGVDMLYAQYLFDSGADIQAIAVPRAATWGGPIRLDQSTLALRGAATFNAIDATLMLARDRGDYVGGVGLSGPLGGASWNAEYLHWQLESGANHPSWLFNISNFGTLGDWNVSYFAEYFHNGFGVSSGTPLDALPPNLTERMLTGQVFFGGRDFLSIGGQFQITPDLTVTPNAIVSLNDASVLAAVGLNYSLGDNTDLTFNYTHPIGPNGTEFGGRETSAGSGLYVGPAQTATLRLLHYF